jgi:hypothetical protein
MNLPDRRSEIRRVSDLDVETQLDLHIEQARTEFQGIEHSVKDLHAILLRHIEDEENWKVKMYSAFPDGPENHRAAHIKLIQSAEAEERFWKELRLDLAKKGLWSIIVVLVGLVMTSVSIKLGWGAK